MKPVTAANLIAVELSAHQRQRLGEHACHTVTLDWFGRRVAVRFEDAGAATIFHTRYADFVCVGSPQLQVTCAATSADEPLIWADPGEAFRYPAAIKAPVVLAFLTDAVTQRAFFDVNPSIMSFHAAALQNGDAAIAISAISTGGKSTTALACVRRGMGLYSDERCVIIAGRVHAFPRAINVRNGGIELLTAEGVPNDGGIEARLRARAGSDWEAASFSDVLGVSDLPQPQPLKGIFFIDGHAAQPKTEALSLPVAITRLMAAAFCGPAPGMDRMVAATALLQQTPAYALILGSPDATAQHLARLMRAESTQALAV